MSQSRSEQVSECTPVTQNDSSLIQEKLSARQAKRAVKAAERQKKSDALKEEGNVFFRSGKFREALDRYQQAIDVHGPSVKPVLLTNLAAVYLKLGMYPEAHDAADRALAADPTSVKARYRRGMARKHMGMWTAADIDFTTMSVLDPDNMGAEADWAYVEDKRYNPLYLDTEVEAMNNYSDLDAPGLDDDPQLGESLSESSDCEHTGNGIPCKFYNRTECKNGRACRFSHAPDAKSERDAFGRNVCRYYLIGACKFGERCSYLHSKEYLLQQGWWSTTEGIEMERSRNKAIADHNNQTKYSRGGQSSKKTPKGNKKRGYRSPPGLGGSESGVQRISPFDIWPGQSSQKIGTRNKKQPSSEWGDYDSDGDDERAMCGFTGSQVNELISYGVKPWDDDAWDVLAAVHSDY